MYSNINQQSSINKISDFYDNARDQGTLQVLATAGYTPESTVEYEADAGAGNPEIMGNVLWGRHGNETTRLRSAAEIPQPYQEIFSAYPHFNVIQSTVFDDILYTDNPIVISAPTGSGKTVLLELAIVKHLMSLANTPYEKIFKIVYLAPIKALCEERLIDWHCKFSKFGLSCISVTGDSDNFDFQSLLNHNLIISTPEKWDSLTRRWRDNRKLAQVVKLFMLDEIHLLNEENRGPTVEAVVSRMKTIQDAATTQLDLNAGNVEVPHKMRFLALSATIPNADDVAEWLGRPAGNAKYFKFSEDMRPVKLKKIVIGFPYKPNMSTPFKFDIMLNYKLGPIILEHSLGKPTLIFCSTRKSVEMTSNYLTQNLTINLSYEQRQTLSEAAKKVSDNKIRAVLVHGVACHHAGIMPENRKIVEGLFRNGDLPILVTTSTLAMGVNLPAHLVIVKSTKMYTKGAYKDYSESAVFQMIGRAGRPQFDKSATAVILTTADEKKKYENMVGGMKPIESNLHRHLTEHLNAEVVLHTITDLRVAMEWLTTTFLHIRARKHPHHYNLPLDLRPDQVDKKLLDMCQIEINKLAKAGMLTISHNVSITSTEIGILMAKYYLDFETMKLFTQVSGGEILQQILGLISRCHEFSEMYLRVADKKCLNFLNSCHSQRTIRFPLKGKIKTLDMKINCIIQAVFGCMQILDPSLLTESYKIMRSAERITRCLAEYLETRDNCYSALYSTLILAKCFSAHLWENSLYVSKQLSGIGLTMSSMLVSAGKTTFEAILNSNPRDLERIINRKMPMGNTIQEQVKHLPRYELKMKISADKSQLEINISLVNVDDLQVKSTANVNSVMNLLVGDTCNEILLYEKYTHAYMIENPSVTKQLEINRKRDDYDIMAHFISDDWVGFDCRATYSFLPKTDKPKSKTSYVQQHLDTFMKKTKPIKARNQLKALAKPVNNQNKNEDENKVSSTGPSTPPSKDSELEGKVNDRSSLGSRESSDFMKCLTKVFKKFSSKKNFDDDKGNCDSPKMVTEDSHHEEIIGCSKQNKLSQKDNTDDGTNTVDDKFSDRNDETVDDRFNNRSNDIVNDTIIDKADSKVDDAVYEAVENTDTAYNVVDNTAVDNFKLNESIRINNEKIIDQIICDVIDKQEVDDDYDLPDETEEVESEMDNSTSENMPNLNDSLGFANNNLVIKPTNKNVSSMQTEPFGIKPPHLLLKQTNLFNPEIAPDQFDHPTRNVCTDFDQPSSISCKNPATPSSQINLQLKYPFDYNPPKSVSSNFDLSSDFNLPLSANYKNSTTPLQGNSHQFGNQTLKAVSYDLDMSPSTPLPVNLPRKHRFDQLTKNTSSDFNLPSPSINYKNSVMPLQEQRKMFLNQFKKSPQTNVLSYNKRSHSNEFNIVYGEKKPKVACNATIDQTAMKSDYFQSFDEMFGSNDRNTNRKSLTWRSPLVMASPVIKHSPHHRINASPYKKLNSSARLLPGVPLDLPLSDQRYTQNSQDTCSNNTSFVQKSNQIEVADYEDFVSSSLMDLIHPKNQNQTETETDNRSGLSQYLKDRYDENSRFESSSIPNNKNRSSDQQPIQYKNQKCGNRNISNIDSPTDFYSQIKYNSSKEIRANNIDTGYYNRSGKEIKPNNIDADYYQTETKPEKQAIFVGGPKHSVEPKMFDFETRAAGFQTESRNMSARLPKPVHSEERVPFLQRSSDSRSMFSQPQNRVLQPMMEPNMYCGQEQVSCLRNRSLQKWPSYGSSCSQNHFRDSKPMYCNPIPPERQFFDTFGHGPIDYYHSQPYQRRSSCNCTGAVDNTTWSENGHHYNNNGYQYCRTQQQYLPTNQHQCLPPKHQDYQQVLPPKQREYHQQAFSAYQNYIPDHYQEVEQNADGKNFVMNRFFQSFADNRDQEFDQENNYYGNY